MKDEFKKSSGTLSWQLVKLLYLGFLPHGNLTGCFLSFRFRLGINRQINPYGDYREYETVNGLRSEGD